MAVDEWLLRTTKLPVLRIYRWESGWGSFGYFVGHREAEAFNPQRRWVRRWTGGGIVDHEADWTYTLAVPGRMWLAGSKGSESYQAIHLALAEALRDRGTELEVVGASSPSAGGSCFVQPVEFDLRDSEGRKLAGAGQRRSRHGLLHQGSLAKHGHDELAAPFAGKLARHVEQVIMSPTAGVLQPHLISRYGCEEWNRRR
jgi:lipoate-protein ligase A